MKSQMLATLLILSSSLAAVAEETNSATVDVVAKKKHEMNGIIAGGIAGIAGAGALTKKYEIYRIYERSSQRLFETPSWKGANMTPSEIRTAMSTVKVGDELRVVYATTDIEERAIRLKLLQERNHSIRTSLALAKVKVDAAFRGGRPAEATSLGNQITDLSYAFERADNAAREIAAGKTPISGRVATAVIDTNKLSLAELETRMLNKLQDGKHIISIDRLPADKLVKTRQARRVIKGQIAIMLFGGLISFRQLTYVPSIKTDNTQEGESIFVPDLHPGEELL